MKHINFNKLSIKNFLSIGDEPVVVDFTKGLHIITGINRDRGDRRNAVGKSSILDGINFAIYGKPVRDIEKDLVPNQFTGNQCQIVLDLTIESNSTDQYKVVRTVNPTSLRLYKNGQDITTHTIAGTNDLIQSLISCKEEVFQNCIIMTANGTTPFMSKKMVEKRKFIEGIFNLEVFSEMLSKVRADYNENKAVCDINSAKFEEINNSLTNYTAQRDTIVKNTQATKNRYEKSINNNNAQIELLKTANTTCTEQSITDKEQLITKYSTAIDKLDDLIESTGEQSSTLKANIEAKIDKTSKIGTSGDVCEVCLKPVTAEDHLHHGRVEEQLKVEIKALYKQLDEVKLKITSHKTKKQQVKAAIDNLKADITVGKAAIEKQKLADTNIAHLQASNERFKSEIEQLKCDTTSIDKAISDTTSKVNDIKKKIDDVKYLLNMLDVVKYIVSEEGVKSFIIKKILDVFNNRIDYYLKKMGSNATCIFDEYFNEVFTNDKGKRCSYFNFSGAERKDIDFACLFTFMDIRRLQGGVSMNISIYDEILDSSVDEKGIELVLATLNERVEKNNECVMVISHRKESPKFATGEIIFLEKQHGITKRIDYVA